MEYFVTCEGIPVHVSESGKGENAIILLHGYLETLYIWEEFRKLLPDSSHIVSIDLPGHGLTGSHPECNSMEFCARVVKRLCDKLCIAKATIIGHSMGGYIGQRFLKDYPESISALIHFNSNPYADNPDKKDQRLKEIEFIKNGKLTQLAQIAIPNMYAKENLREFDEKIVETVEICETHDPLGIASAVRGLMEREDNVELLRSASVPVAFVFGDSDSYASMEVIEKIKSDLPGAQHFIIKNTGHNSFIERPVSVMEAISVLVK